MSSSPITFFQSEFYLLHNQKRLEHLASLNLDLERKSVLEVGAGIGDHTDFYIKRGCDITSVEARAENLEVLKIRYPEVKVRCLDLDTLDFSFDSNFDVIHCYGLLYHLKHPSEMLTFLANYCKGMLLLETCVSLGNGEKINHLDEPATDPTQSFTGVGCRPTREWVFKQLNQNFDFVYVPTTQPDHNEFPTDWTKTEITAPYARAIFIGSKQPIQNPLLLSHLPEQQTQYHAELK